MSCDLCKDVPDIVEKLGPYFVRNCEGCGRELRFRKPGRGLTIENGEKLVIPGEFLSISANPLKSGGKLYRKGLEWFAEHVFVHNLAQRQAVFQTALEEMDSAHLAVIKACPLLQEFDIESIEQQEAIFKVLESNKDRPEWWLYVANAYMAIATAAIEQNNASQAAWAMACAERHRALYIFKAEFEEAVWMGQSARMLIDLIRLWDAHKENSAESFWQSEFQSRSLALSQLFSVPVTVIKDSAYVGGQGIDRRDSRLVDFLLSGGSSRDAILVEIKTPKTRLISKGKYRQNVHAPSADLVGAVAQALDYRATFTLEFQSIVRNQKYDLAAFNPKAVVIIGNSAELDTDGKRRSFEFFRSNLKDVEVVTFDEVFRKIEHLASLFGLIKSTPSKASA